jgi:hypothetical protein
MIAEQEAALGDYVKLAVQAADPALQFRITRGENVPIPDLGSALLRLPSSTSDAAVELPDLLPDPEDETKLIERVTERGVVRVELELRVARPPETAASAWHLVGKVRRVLGREAVLEALAGSGVDVLSVGDVVDVSAFVRDSEHESRASLAIVVSYAVAEDTRIDKIAAVTIAGTLNPGALEGVVEAPE